MDSYESFIFSKTHSKGEIGFEPKKLGQYLFPFQDNLTRWALLKGRAAIFADTGLGKTAIAIAWCEALARERNARCLILTPLAVGHQFISNRRKWDVPISKVGQAESSISVMNYERLHLINPSDFDAVVCDESAILKSFDGIRRTEITRFLTKVKWRLMCSATPAPNDYVELGNTSEALGYMGFTDMLGKFFKPEDGKGLVAKRGWGEQTKYRWRGHAEMPFWQWVCSWARAVRLPSDIGFDDSGYVLPPLIETQHIVRANTLAPGMLFEMAAVGLQEQREEIQRTVKKNAAKWYPNWYSIEINRSFGVN